jgi:hypothetical protein
VGFCYFRRVGETVGDLVRGVRGTKSGPMVHGVRSPCSVNVTEGTPSPTALAQDSAIGPSVASHDRSECT